MANVFVIAPVGLDGQDRLVVNTAVKLLTHDGVTYQLRETEPAKAHLLILDEDCNEGKHALKLSRPGQVKLVVSSKPTPARNTIGVPRPVELGFLKSVLKKLYIKLDGQASAQQVAVTDSKPVQASQVLQGSLFNLLLDARENKQILRLSNQALPEFFIDGRNHCLATTANETEVNQLVNTPVESFAVTRMNPDSFAVHSNDMSIQSLYNLLWLAGIKCSHGRLLPGHKLDTPFRLRAWPNFTRNSFIANHLKLAAVLAKQTLSLSQLVEMTQVSLPEVIDFYNAAFAVDLIEYCDSDDLVSVASPPRNLAKQGLLAKIAKRLSLKGIF